jgi:2-polyprenyl-3-methyl-5-hydroxy-6-metoxy-1,4-benzoquinol methylase
MSDHTKGLLSPFLRQRRIANTINYIKGKVLDFGCGTGLLAKYIPSKFYIGVDIDQDSLDIAKKNSPGYTFLNTNKIGFNDIKQHGPFDTMVLMAVIEHIKEPDKLLVELSKLINYSGQIVITTPHPASSIIHNIGSKIGLFSKTANKQHENYYNYEQMKRLCLKNNLKILNYKRFLLGINQLFILKLIN